MVVILVLPNSRSEVSGSVRLNDVGSSAQRRSVMYNSLTNHVSAWKKSTAMSCDTSGGL